MNRVHPVCVLLQNASLNKLVHSACMRVLQVRRTKEILSANTAAPLSVEELHDGIDYQVCMWAWTCVGTKGELRLQ